MSSRGFTFGQIIKSCIASILFLPVTQSPPVEAMVPTRRVIRGFDLILDDPEVDPEVGPEVGPEEPAGPPPPGACALLKDASAPCDI